MMRRIYPLQRFRACLFFSSRFDASMGKGKGLLPEAGDYGGGDEAFRAEEQGMIW